MQMNKNVRKGFTLVEVIVVLVVLAILAAIMIPAMTGWITKAKEKRLVVACRTCVTAAQTLASESYGETGSRELPSPTDVLELARINGSVSGIAFLGNSVRVSHLTYTAPDGEHVTYCCDATCGDYYNFSGASGGLQYVSGDTPEKLFSSAYIQNILRKATSVDSGAPMVRPSGESTYNGQLAALLAHRAGFNIASWAARNGGQQLYWTDMDISNMTPGTSVRVILYDAKAKTYTAGYVKVENKKDTSVSSKPYNVLGTSLTGGNTPTADYAEAVGTFNGMNQTA